MDGRHHPLQNHLILENIFQYLNLKELAICRQVSKTWRLTCSKAWKTRSSVAITKNNTTSFVNFVRNTSNLDELPAKLYCNYILKEMNCGAKRFWKLCGSNIKEISLVDCFFATVNDFRNAFFKQCPNVQRLELVRVSARVRRNKSLPEILPSTDVDEPNNWTQFKLGEPNKNLKWLKIQRRSGYLNISWTELFSYFPLVETLHLYGSDVNDNSLFESLNKLRKQNTNNLRLKEIRALNMDSITSTASVISPQLATLATSHDLHMECLAFGANGNDAASHLSNIIQTHYGSLKRLEIYRNTSLTTLSPRHCFPSLNKEKLINLEELYMHTMMFSSLSFLNCTPNLKKLVVCNTSLGQFNNINETTDRHANDNIFFADNALMSGIQLQRCKHLEVGVLTSQHDLELLVQWMPSVTKLKISHLDNKKFAFICQYWPNLVDFGITYGQVNEVGITGIDEGVVRNMELDEDSLYNDLKISIERTKANITNLTDLKRFSMSASTLAMPLNYSAAVYGLEPLPKLTNISFSNYKENPQVLWYLWRLRMYNDRNIEFQMHHDY